MRRPVWSLIAIGTACAVVGVALGLARQTNRLGPAGSAGFFACLALLLAFGIVAGGVSLARRERFWALAVLGLVLNVPLLLMDLYYLLGWLIAIGLD